MDLIPWPCPEIFSSSAQTQNGYNFSLSGIFQKSVPDLKEMFFNSGKYLISGIGGIGKTELMRQLVSWMEQEEVKCRIPDKYSSRYIPALSLHGFLPVSFLPRIFPAPPSRAD